MRCRSLIVGVFMCSFAAGAHAALLLPAGWTRPADDAEAMARNTTYQHWNFFSSPGGPNDPDVAEVNPFAGLGPNESKANVFDTSGTSFVTGGGNIYSPTGVVQMHVTLPGAGLGAGHETSFLFQIVTQGAELVRVDETPTYDFSRFLIDGVAIEDLDGFSYQELSRVVLGGFGGAAVEHAFAFSVPGSAGSYEITYSPPESSVSQDRVSVDTRVVAVPEPAVLALCAVAAWPVLRRRRA